MSSPEDGDHVGIVPYGIECIEREIKGFPKGDLWRFGGFLGDRRW